MNTLTHFNAQGQAHMVDVGDKVMTERVAVAQGEIALSDAALQMVVNGNSKKGDVLGIARIAAIMATKKTHELIPLCHPLMISHVDVDFQVNSEKNKIVMQTTVKTCGQTGIEMEALTAISVGLLTIYDMLKAIDKTMVIGNIALLEKSGGRSGHFIR